MGLEAPIHQTHLKFVGVMVGTTNPSQVCGHGSGHMISWTLITRKRNNTLCVSVFTQLSSRSKAFYHDRHQEYKCVNFLESLLLKALVFLDICHRKKNNGHMFSWRFVDKKKQQATYHMPNDNVRKKRCINWNNTSPRRRCT